MFPQPSGHFHLRSIPGISEHTEAVFEPDGQGLCEREIIQHTCSVARKMPVPVTDVKLKHLRIGIGFADVIILRTNVFDVGGKTARIQITGPVTRQAAFIDQARIDLSRNLECREPDGNQTTVKSGPSGQSVSPG